MNKEFLDPNTRYSDQKVDLAKIPGMLQTINQSLAEMGDNVGDIQDTLDTSGATAGQVLKVETPGEVPVWGEAGGGGTLKFRDFDYQWYSTEYQNFIRQSDPRSTLSFTLPGDLNGKILIPTIRAAGVVTDSTFSSLVIATAIFDPTVSTNPGKSLQIALLRLSPQDADYTAPSGYRHIYFRVYYLD